MPSNQELQARIKELEEQLASTQGVVTLEEDFAKEVWKAVLIGAVSTLFDPNRISIDNRPKALDHYLKRALTIADKAAEVARNHREHEDKEEEARIVNDPLRDLLHDAP